MSAEVVVQLKFQPPRTPQPYRRVRELASPLARYGKSLPCKLPSLRAWKDVCQEHLSSSSKSSPPAFSAHALGDNPLFSLRCLNVPDLPGVQSQSSFVSVDALSPMHTRSLKRKLEEAGLELPQSTDGVMRCMLEAGRESRVKRARTGRLAAAERRAILKEAAGNE